jgi:hypothetical protein
MGGTESKLDIPEKPVFDISKAKVDLPSVQDFQDKTSSAFDELSKQAEDLNSKVWSTTGYLYALLGLVVAGGIGYLIYNYVVPYFQSLNKPSQETLKTGSGLNVFSAELTSGKDIKSQLVNKISNNELDVKIDEKYGAKPGDSLNVYFQHIGSSPEKKTVSYGDILKIVPKNGTSSSSSQSKSKSWYGSTTQQLSSLKDGTELYTIPSANGPQESSVYSYQFWIFIKDWNYKFGQDKHVFSRSDSSNKSVANPSVLLHPTDNTLKISVSVYPTEKTSKNEPAPAGHSGTTDDVFICEIPNIPLQQWTSISISMSTKNLDIYINGKLVKSCLLPGIPKPAMGDIILNENGGFSGWMCSFNQYSKSLVPTDAQTFYSFGAPCRLPGDSYNAQLSIFSSEGKEKSKYMF